MTKAAGTSTKFVFEKAFDFHPDGDWRSIVEYLPSTKPQTVTRECAKKAKAAGAGDYHKDDNDEKRTPKKQD